MLGVVYGDIGTSPLYALKATIAIVSTQAPTRWEILGIESLIFWSLILVVTIKYVTLIMRADNNGEGGILALMALAQRVSTGVRVARDARAWSASSAPACSSATAPSRLRSRCSPRSRGSR